jgi:uncharacterized protein YaiI (UPF0178 family)
MDVVRTGGKLLGGASPRQGGGTAFACVPAQRKPGGQDVVENTDLLGGGARQPVVRSRGDDFGGGASERFERRKGTLVRLWIDADAAPRDVKEIVFRAAKRLEMQTVLVANQRMPVPPGNAFVTAVRVEGGPDVADLYIVEQAAPGDVAVTADIPLAAALVEKGVAVIDPRGDEFNAENVGERLAVRDFMDGLRGAGVETGGSRPYGPRDKQAFAGSLDRILTRALRGR